MANGSSSKDRGYKSHFNQYSALLRLPRELTFKEKLARVEKIIELLRLQDCANTREIEWTSVLVLILIT